MKDKVFAFLTGFALALICSVLILAVGTCCSDAAPAPLPRPKKAEGKDRPAFVDRMTAEDVVGDWRLIWAGSEWHYSFGKDGQCFGEVSRDPADDPLDGYYYRGHWAVDAQDRLIVTEQQFSRAGPAVGGVETWYVVWSKDGAGKVRRHSPDGDAQYTTDGSSPIGFGLLPHKLKEGNDNRPEKERK